MNSSSLGTVHIALSRLILIGEDNSLGTAYHDFPRLILIGEEQHFKNCSVCERSLNHWRIETDKITNYSTNVNNIEFGLCTVSFVISLTIIMNYVSNMETFQ